ncbi:CYFA0S11e01156g1_1 [Cyberlindnera fabianii]|uniref:Sugar phosphate phosphatase n=1 Tax=Cyberlindnera fabianii TaxID=36022 RepID=A0A061B113_CYBFA|nr:Protein-glutamate O-methyltransferase [Cyberlindnera fabianii]CDR43180.1 CYFA0S11e01156g1_1 [Cyberlindnera fabianii]
MSELPPVYFNNDPDSFAYSTARVRWIKIIQDAVDDVNATVEASTDAEVKSQGETISKKLAILKEELLADAVVQPLAGDSKQFKSFNRALGDHGYTWLTGPWLMLENHLYRLINSFFIDKSRWFNYDIFHNLKKSSFESSVAGVTELALRYAQLTEQKEQKVIEEDVKALLFREFAEISLWGNATDLSLLATATLDDIKSIQGADARKKSEDKILCNDIDKAYKQLKESKDAIKSVDFVLDNSGFELYTDLIFALFLIDFGICQKVTLHTKDIPWMVSDVNIKDFGVVLSQLKDTKVFPDHRREIDFFVDKVEYLYNTGVLTLETSPFWTLDQDFWGIDPSETEFGGSQLHERLLKSSLVVFKGDMNYRKLTADRRWPSTTPFTTALGPLATSGIKLLSLRTVKADVLVGLPEGVYEQICETWGKEDDNKLGWLYSGKYAVISFSSGSA